MAAMSETQARMKKRQKRSDLGPKVKIRRLPPSSRRRSVHSMFLLEVSEISDLQKGSTLLSEDRGLVVSSNYVSSIGQANH